MPSTDLLDRTRHWPWPRRPNRQDVGIAKLLAEHDCLPETLAGALDMPVAHCQQAGNDQAVSLFDARRIAVLEEPLRTTEPAGSLGHLAGEKHGEAEPEAPARRPFRLTPVDENVVHARPEGGCTRILADEICRRREPFQIIRFERHVIVCSGQVLVRLSPLPPSERLPTPGDQVGRCHDAIYHMTR